MKKVIITAVMGLLLSSTCMAQFTGGGEDKALPTQPATQVKAKKEKDDSPFKRSFFIRGGIASARGMLGKLPTAGKSLTAPFKNEDGMGVNRGYTFEFGFFSYFHKEPIMDNIKIGLKTSFETSLLIPDWSHLSNDWQNRTVDPILIGSAGLGPVISYNPIDKLVVDAYFQVRLASNVFLGYKPVSGGSTQLDPATGTEVYSSFGLTPDSQLSLRTRQVIGLNVRYSVLILGVSLQYGTGNYSYNLTYETSDNYAYLYQDQTADVFGQTQFTSPLKLGTTQFTIGFIF